jgi:hypothetical protein
MPRYSSFSPGVQVLGQTMLAFIECINRDNIMPYLSRQGLLGRHGLEPIRAEKWYPLQSWLYILSDLSEESGHSAMFDFVSIGMKMLETGLFPAEFHTLSIEEVFQRWNDFYLMNHRGGDVGEFITEVIDKGHIRITARVPYPDDIFYGLFFAIARKFLPQGTRFVVEYSDEAPRRDEGGDITLYDIVWDL